MPNDDIEAVGTYTETFGPEFQRHILACCLKVPGFVGSYRTALDHTFFSSDVLRAAAKGLFIHCDKFNTLPSIATLLETIRPDVDDGMVESVKKVLSGISKRKVEDYEAVREHIVEFGKLQALVNACLDNADDLEKGDRSHIKQRIDDALMVGEDIIDIGLNYTERMAERAAEYIDPDADIRDVIPTGVVHLDRALGGGPGRGELWVVLSPPKRGKSTTMINFGYGALISTECFNVVHYTFEMSAKKVERRYDDRLAGPNIIKLKNKDMKAYGDSLADRAKKYIRGNLFIKRYPSRGVGVSALRSHLMLLSAQGFKADLVIVDYADIMKPERRIGEMRHEQAGIYEDLRNLAGEFNVAVITGSQASKGALTKDTMTMEDFAEAFEKAAIMDGGIAFCESAAEKAKNTARLYMFACRDVEDGLFVECAVDRSCCRIKSLTLIHPDYGRVVGEGDDPNVPNAHKDKGAVSNLCKAPTSVKKKKPYDKSTQGSRRKAARPSKRID